MDMKGYWIVGLDGTEHLGIDLIPVIIANIDIFRKSCGCDMNIKSQLFLIAVSLPI